MTGAFYLYAYFFTGAVVVLLVASLRDLRNSSGRIRSELGYFLLGSTSILVLTLGAYQILRFFVPPSQLFWFAPLRAVLFTLIIAYGISTRKIIDVGLLLRRALSYGVLTTYLLALYGAVWWLVVQVTASLFYSTDHTFAHIAAALVCTFAMARMLAEALPNVNAGKSSGETRWESAELGSLNRPGAPSKITF